METSGIVRRIDDLGRVVIPKEVRRVFRIQEGDPLEIFVTKEGILFKKYSPVGNLRNFANEYCESLFENTGFATMITDTDDVIAISGVSCKEHLDRRIGGIIEDCLENRKSIHYTDEGKYELIKDDEMIYSSFVIVPIVHNGDPIGSVILYSKDNKQLGTMELKMAETAASFLAKQMNY